MNTNRTNHTNAQMIAARTAEAIGSTTSAFENMTVSEIETYLIKLTEAGIVLDDDTHTAAEAMFEIANS